MKPSFKKMTLGVGVGVNVGVGVGGGWVVGW
jgi:hypothetical protein